MRWSRSSTISQRRSPIRTNPRRRSCSGFASRYNVKASAICSCAPSPAISGKSDRSARAATRPAITPSSSISRKFWPSRQTATATRGVTSTCSVPASPSRTRADRTPSSASTAMRIASRSSANDETGKSIGRVSETRAAKTSSVPVTTISAIINSGRCCTAIFNASYLATVARRLSSCEYQLTAIIPINASGTPTRNNPRTPGVSIMR